MNSPSAPRRIQAVLFDLDGTLIDSAPDLVGAIEAVCRQEGVAPPPYAQLRAHVGSGARGMVGAALGVAPGEPRFEALKDAFLSHYHAHLLDHTRPFAHIDALLRSLEHAAIPWGIVTNKHERYALPVVQGLGFDTRTRGIVCGDTTPHAKPHPEPLHECARRLGVESAACVYVGDDLRDVQAARAAGMPALVALWGYLGDGEPPEAWGADALLKAPQELLRWLAIE